MEEGRVFRTLEKDGTKFVVYNGHEEGFDSNFFIKASGRLNFLRGIQSFDAYLLKSASYYMMLKYVLRGTFVVNEEGEEYTFEPIDEGWSVNYKDDIFKLKGEKEVLDVISASSNVKEILESQKITELVTSESKEALSTLSEMLDNNVLDLQKLEEIKAFSEQSNDERIKDMIRIVEKHFRNKSNYKESDINISVIE